MEMSKPVPAVALLTDLESLFTTGRDALALDYVLDSPNRRFELSHVRFPGGNLRLLDSWLKRMFQTVEARHRRRDFCDAPLTVAAVATEFAALGEDLSTARGVLSKNCPGRLAHAIYAQPNGRIRLPNLRADRPSNSKLRRVPRMGGQS